MTSGQIPGPLRPEKSPASIKDGTSVLAPSPKPVPIGSTADKCPAAEDVVIQYGANADKAAMTANALKVLREICAKACISSVQITSTARTAKDQARVMYEMIQSRGVEYVKKLYGSSGQQVVEAYEETQKKNLTAEEVKAAMLDKINEVGPRNVSHHVVGSDGKLCVFDVAPSSIPANLRDKFVKEAKANAKVKQFFEPPKDPAYHLEVEN
jgi:hypothetical protein